MRPFIHSNQHIHTGDPRLVRSQISREDNDRFIAGLYAVERAAAERRRNRRTGNALYPIRLLATLDAALSA